MLVRAKDYVRSTLASHEKTRRLAELATDAVCGATESVVDNYGAWIPLGWVARDAAGVFRREAFDVLQAPYASLKTSVNTLEGLIPHLRSQLTTIETELFEARARAHVLEQQLRDEEAHVQYLQLERTNAVQRGRELERSLRGGGEERMGRVLVEEEMERVRALEGRRDEMQRAIDALRSVSEHGHGLSTPPTSERDIPALDRDEDDELHMPGSMPSPRLVTPRHQYQHTNTFGRPSPSSPHPVIVHPDDDPPPPLELRGEEAEEFLAAIGMTGDKLRAFEDEMAREAAQQGIPTLASGASFSTFSSLEDQYPPELLESHHLVEARVHMPNVPPPAFVSASPFRVPPTLDGDQTVVASPHRLSVSLPPPLESMFGCGEAQVQSPEKMDAFAAQQEAPGMVSMEDMPGSTALSGSMEDMPAREDSMEAVSGHVHVEPALAGHVHVTAEVEVEVEVEADVSLVTHATADSTSTRDEEVDTTGRATLDVQSALQALLSTSASSIYDVEDSSVENDEDGGEEDEEEYTEFWMPSFAMDTPAEEDGPAPLPERVVNVVPNSSSLADSSPVLASLAGPPSLVTLPEEDEHLPVPPQLRPSIEVVLDKAETDGFPFLATSAPASTLSSSSESSVHPLTLDVPSVVMPQSPPPEVVASPFVLPSSSPALDVPEVAVVPASPLEVPEVAVVPASPLEEPQADDKLSTTPVPPSPHSFETGVEPTPSLSSTDATVPDRPTSRRSGALDVERYVVGTSEPGPAVHFPSSASKGDAMGADGNGNGMVLPVRGRAKSTGEKHKGKLSHMIEAGLHALERRVSLSGQHRRERTESASESSEASVGASVAMGRLGERPGGSLGRNASGKLVKSRSRTSSLKVRPTSDATEMGELSASGSGSVHGEGSGAEERERRKSRIRNPLASRFSSLRDVSSKARD